MTCLHHADDVYTVLYIHNYGRPHSRRARSLGWLVGWLIGRFSSGLPSKVHIDTYHTSDTYLIDVYQNGIDREIDYTECTTPIGSIPFMSSRVPNPIYMVSKTDSAVTCYIPGRFHFLSHAHPGSPRPRRVTHF